MNTSDVYAKFLKGNGKVKILLIPIISENASAKLAPIIYMIIKTIENISSLLLYNLFMYIT